MPHKAPENQPAATFEAGLDQLEAVVKQLESGELPLDRAMELFEKGVQLSDNCRKQLEDAETRVEILLKKNDKVQPEPFQPDQA